MIDAIKTYYSPDKKIKLCVGIMDGWFIESPREDYNLAELTTREHRYYNLPKEFSFDWDAYDEGDMKEVEEMDKKYHLFFLDCYEHSGMVWSLCGEGMQCQFDTAKRAWLIRINKNEIPDREVALWEVKLELERYNQRLNGEVYEWRMERLVKRTSEDGREREEREYIDSCGWFYDIKDAVEDAKTFDESDVIVIED